MLLLLSSFENFTGHVMSATEFSPSNYIGRPTPFPYIVYTTDYTHFSSGVRALHMLCHALNRAGCEAYVMAGVTDPWLNTPTISLIRRDSFRVSGRLPIIIYPEIVAGNPLEEMLVVRWLLNKPGRFIDNWEGAFGRQDMIFYHDKDFLVQGVTGTRLVMPECDIGTYNNFDNPHDGQRQGYVLYMSRFLKTGEVIPDFLKDAVIVSPDNPRTPGELAELYRRSEYMFSFERTAAVVEANLCGCPCVLMESSLLSEIPNQAMFGTNGVAWGFTEEETTRAKRTVGKTWEIYRGLVAQFDIELRGFIEITQSRAAHMAELAKLVRHQQSERV